MEDFMEDRETRHR